MYRVFLSIAITLILTAFGHATATAQAETTCGWTTAAPSGIERAESQTVSWNDKMYVITGFTGYLDLANRLDSYDPLTDQWDSLAPLPLGVTHCGVSVYGDQLWVVGGFVGDSPGPATDTVQVYDFITDTWSFGPSLPAPRGSGAAVFVGRKLHYFGGLLPDRMTEIDEHYVLDLDDLGAGWVGATPMMHAINHHSGIFAGGKIYAIGGRLGHDGFHNDQDYLQIYDPVTGIWTAGADLPTDRSHFESSTFTLDGDIYIGGGRNQNNYFPEILQYNLATDNWSTFCDLADTIISPAMQFVSDILVQAHGGDNGASNPTDTTRLSTIARTPDFSMYLLEDTLNLTMAQDESSALEALLYTYSVYPDFSVDTAGTAPDWLQVLTTNGTVGDSGEEIELNIEGGLMLPGDYTATILITAAGYAPVALTVNLTLTPCVSCVLCDVAPLNLQHEFVGHKVKISWDEVPSSLGYKVKGRKVGTPAFNSIIVLGTSREIGGLTMATTYEWKVRALCSDSTFSPFSPLDTFSTPSARTSAAAPTSGKWSVFPNPVIQTLCITAKSSTSVERELRYRILSVEGRLLDKGQLASGENCIDVQQLSAGMYVLHLQDLEGVSTSQFVVD